MNNKRKKVIREKTKSFLISGVIHSNNKTNPETKNAFYKSATSALLNTPLLTSVDSTRSGDTLK